MGCATVCRDSDGREALDGGAGCGAVSASHQHHIPTEQVENSRDRMSIPPQFPQAETRTVCEGPGCYQAETTIAHQRWAGSLSSIPFSIWTDSSSHFHLMCCLCLLR